VEESKYVMKRIYIIILTAATLFAGCEEFQPVFTGRYENPPMQDVVVDGEGIEATHTIAQLVAMYKGVPWVIDKDVVIAGKVSTTDQPGNFYKSFYIQDETGGMEIKVGRNGLYNEYKLGQTVYVRCEGLTLGMYGFKDGNYGGQGMVQVGYADPTGEYETSYLEHQILADMHILKGAYGDPLTPVVLTESQLPGANDTQKINPYLGTLVTLKGLKYANETFTLLYLDSNQNKKDSKNRIFLSDKTWGVTTWAMSKSKMQEYLHSGMWDDCKLGNANDQNYGTVGDRKVVDEKTGEVSYPDIEKAAYSVSQYFKMGNKEIQIRTSGYCKFSDTELDPDVLSGKATIDVTGILTLYPGSIQFILLDLNGGVVNKTSTL
jgi:hypothetical protein